jgi:hypothetical protein
MHMNIQDAIQTGFLNLNEEQTGAALDLLFDNDDAGTRLNEGVELLRTFVPEDKIPFVLDLVAIILDANEELESEHDHDHDHDHDHHHDD